MSARILATALALGALTAVPAPAGAAATCLGRPATIVAAPGQTVVTGTGDDDVVVAAGPVSIDAGAGKDRVCVSGAGLDVDLGPGADRVALDARGGVPPTGRLVGGPGRDEVEVVAEQRAVVDLDRGVLVVTGAGGTSELGLGGFADAVLDAASASFVGDGRDNDARLYGCSVTAFGSAGADRVVASRRPLGGPVCGDGPKALFSGGAGADVLLGGRRNDSLRGGAGYDRLVGGPGVDYCDTGERVRGCER